jgi:hypothetical protein
MRVGQLHPPTRNCLPAQAVDNACKVGKAGTGGVFSSTRGGGTAGAVQAVSPVALVAFPYQSLNFTHLTHLANLPYSHKGFRGGLSFQPSTGNAGSPSFCHFSGSWGGERRAISRSPGHKKELPRAPADGRSGSTCHFLDTKVTDPAFPNETWHKSRLCGQVGRHLVGIAAVSVSKYREGVDPGRRGPTRLPEVSTSPSTSQRQQPRRAPRQAVRRPQLKGTEPC